MDMYKIFDLIGNLFVPDGTNIDTKDEIQGLNF